MDQSVGKRRTRLAVEQREALLSFMEKNPALATGRFPGSHGSKIKAQLWNELSDYLNRMGAMGQGTTKTPDRWMKVQNGHYSDDNEYKFVDNGALTVDISSPSPSESHNLSPVQSSSLSPVTCIAQSTSSYPAGSSHQASNTLSSSPPTSPTLRDLKQSPRDSAYSPEPETVVVPQPTKRRRYQVDRVPDEQSGATVNPTDSRELVIRERLAEALKARAEASVIEAAAEERKATAAERTATALEREAAALERKAAAMERLAAATERKALAAERESSFLARHPQY